MPPLTYAGFGVAIIFQLGWHVVGLFIGGAGSLLEGVANLTVMGISTQVFMLGALRKHRNNELVCLFAVSDVVGAVLGTTTLTTLNNDQVVWVERILGGFLLLVAFQRLYVLHIKPWRAKRSASVTQVPDTFDLRKAGTKLACASAGFGAGFIGGLTGIGGPVLMVFMSFYTPPIEDFKFANAVTRLGTPLARIAVFLWRQSPVFGRDKWPTYCALCITSVMGVCVGHMLSGKVDIAVIHQIIVAFLFAASMLMCVTGSPEGERAAFVLIMGALVIAALALLIRCAARLVTPSTSRNTTGADARSLPPEREMGGARQSADPCGLAGTVARVQGEKQGLEAVRNPAHSAHLL
jgi:uncharacterized membrane protein YfcA